MISSVFAPNFNLFCPKPIVNNLRIKNQNMKKKKNSKLVLGVTTTNNMRGEKAIIVNNCAHLEHPPQY